MAEHAEVVFTRHYTIDRRLLSAVYYLVKRACEMLDEPLTRTKVVKLLFLADLRCKAQVHRTISGAEYKYYTYGPFAPEILAALQDMDGYEITEEAQPYPTDAEEQLRYCYKPGDQPEFDLQLDEDQRRIIDSVVQSYGPLPLQELLDHVYNTPAMRSAEPLQIVLSDAE